MQGKITKGIAGFYYVFCEDGNLYECKAKGRFRKDNRKPLVGDDVEITILDKEQKLGHLEEIMPRMNELIRPLVSNIDGALIIFALKQPEPNLNLLDRFLIMMQQNSLPCAICFNKEDIVSDQEKENMKKRYENTQYPLFFTSASKGLGIDDLREFLSGQTWAVAGPSGVGKSSVINCLQDSIQMQTGAISEKNARGKHTTRHSELIPIDQNTYIMDTPGFSSLDVFELEKEDLRFYYPEMGDYEGMCKFDGCTHTHEPGCAVKAAVEEGEISPVRYHNYLCIYKELEEKRKY